MKRIILFFFHVRYHLFSGSLRFCSHYGNTSEISIEGGFHFILKFFQSVNSRNESGMLSTVADQLTSFLGQSMAGKADVATFLNKIYKSDITNMNWHIIDDYKISKKAGTNGAADYTGQFTAEKNISRTDASQPTYNRYVISATVSSDGKISGLNMKRVPLQ